MAGSGQVARAAPDAMTPAGSAAPGQQAPTSGFDQQMAQRLVRLGLLRQMLRSRRTYERLALVFIVVGALRGLGQENRASTMARLSAWNKRELDRIERKAKEIV